MDLFRPFKLPSASLTPSDASKLSLGMLRTLEWKPKPLHDPYGEFAIVLFDPSVDKLPEDEDNGFDLNVEAINSETLSIESSDAEEFENNHLNQISLDVEPTTEKKKELIGEDLNSLFNLNKPTEAEVKRVPVVIDPTLAKILRPHQVEGATFLYRCTMGLVDSRAHGCIMADEMGLGKTLQCIALLWTLLRQCPNPSAVRKSTIEKAVVICPSSLVNNWANEFDKWLGKNSVNTLAVDGKSIKSNELSSKLKDWAQAKGRGVSQPVLIISYETLRRNVQELGEAEIGLLLADEGHRLKNGDSLTFNSLNALNVKRRVILSGTPIQNDLSEYFSLLDFANPGFLGTRAEFRKNFELQILRGRDADATDEQVTKGAEKLKELLGIVHKFIIRRSNDILSKYLPVKHEHVVFCGLTPFQKNRTQGRNRSGAVRPWYSGKFLVLSRMLARIREDTDDKIVLISNYTQTLDMIEMMCRENKYGSIRLDGTMPINKRQKLVDRFNDSSKPEFIFLLSSKAGGCGINLIGANRLVLLDPDWNPASDQQALARVWRDGQKKDCFIYRFIATGTIEEKILQRQSMKQSLSSCVVDEKTDVERLFSQDMLKALFRLNESTTCDTHDTFKCRRCNENGQFVKASVMLYGDATTWNHYQRNNLSAISDKLLQQESSESIVDFVFQYISH
ncbi:hypothetical protein FF38_08273 [Lucilia cuprina]|uniref:DNA repair and recombination protein RAD54-like n=1 Tax=Lucilia cuprina TaxID=7375 RepID=A0A0L0CH83_LUCCU|nr:hypothetical protein FF38_08273 [Lucilia cuprina]